MEEKDEELIALAIDFADHHSHFDAGFIFSLEESYIKFGRLTEKQRDSLHNIVRKWKMREWADK